MPPIRNQRNTKTQADKPNRLMTPLREIEGADSTSGSISYVGICCRAGAPSSSNPSIDFWRSWIEPRRSCQTWIGVFTGRRPSVRPGLVPSQEQIRCDQLRLVETGGPAISTSPVEGTVNRLIGRRLGKAQHMCWTKREAHLLLKVRCAALNDELLRRAISDRILGVRSLQQQFDRGLNAVGI
jgi:hypothetical protein